MYACKFSFLDRCNAGCTVPATTSSQRYVTHTMESSAMIFCVANRRVVEFRTAVSPSFERLLSSELFFPSLFYSRGSHKAIRFSKTCLDAGLRSRRLDVRAGRSFGAHTDAGHIEAGYDVCDCSCEVHSLAAQCRVICGAAGRLLVQPRGLHRCAASPGSPHEVYRSAVSARKNSARVHFSSDSLLK